MDKIPGILEYPLVGGCPHDIFYITPTPIDLDGVYFQVNRAGFTSRTPGEFSIFRDDTYYYNLIHCVMDGRGWVTFRDKKHKLEKGQIFILGAHESHKYWSDHKNPMALAWVEFGGGNSTQITKHILDLAGPVFGQEVFQEVTSLCTSILYHPHRRTPKVSRIIYDMLMQICMHVDGNSQKSITDSGILNYIDDNLGSQLTLSSVSAEFGYNPAYFSSRFSKNVGMSFSKYIMYRRISRACYLLVTTEWPIERIAHELGFYDMSHFIQRFKSAMDVTPTKYRKQSLGMADGGEKDPSFDVIESADWLFENE